ncbi:unnamed protein product, partial [Discosporangium mesarthrocarpum]
ENREKNSNTEQQEVHGGPSSCFPLLVEPACLLFFAISLAFLVFSTAVQARSWWLKEGVRLGDRACFCTSCSSSSVALWLCGSTGHIASRSTDVAGTAAGGQLFWCESISIIKVFQP